MYNIYYYISKDTLYLLLKWILDLLLISEFEDLGSWGVHVTVRSICHPDIVRMLRELLRGLKNRYRILILFLPPLIMDSSFIFLVTCY